MENRDPMRTMRDDDHDLLIRVETKQDLMLQEIGGLKTTFTQRLSALETEVSSVKMRLYGGWLVITVLYALAGLYVNWHK